MWKYTLKRVLLMIPQLLLVSVFVFVLSKLQPGNPAIQEALKIPNVTPELMAELEKKYHLDQNVFVQYKEWLFSALQGDLGNSYQFKIPVVEIISSKLLNTAVLGLFSFVTILLIGIPLGIVAGKRNGSFIDKIIVGYNYVSIAIPSFIIGIIILFIFGYNLRWFPRGGSVDPGVYNDGNTFEIILSRIYHVALPGLTSGILGTVGIIQYLRNEIIDVKYSDFVKTARAKGVGKRRLYRVHILRNSFIPVAAVLGFYITAIFAGSVLIETVFSYPGVGQLFITSLSNADYPIVMGITIFSSMLALLGSLLSDLILVSVDPRLRIK